MEKTLVSIKSKYPHNVRHIKWGDFVVLPSNIVHFYIVRALHQQASKHFQEWYWEYHSIYLKTLKKELDPHLVFSRTYEYRFLPLSRRQVWQRSLSSILQQTDLTFNTSPQYETVYFPHTQNNTYFISQYLSEGAKKVTSPSFTEFVYLRQLDCMLNKLHEPVVLSQFIIENYEEHMLSLMRQYLTMLTEDIIDIIIVPDIQKGIVKLILVDTLGNRYPLTRKNAHLWQPLYDLTMLFVLEPQLIFGYLSPLPLWETLLSAYCVYNECTLVMLSGPEAYYRHPYLYIGNTAIPISILVKTATEHDKLVGDVTRKYLAMQGNEREIVYNAQKQSIAQQTTDIANTHVLKKIQQKIEGDIATFLSAANEESEEIKSLEYHIETL